MQWKYVVLYHSRHIGSFEELERLDLNYRLNDAPISLTDALVCKNKGQALGYPKSEIRYHFVIEPVEDGWNVRIGKSLTAHESSKGDIKICCIGDYNAAYPKRRMLDIMGILIRGLLSQYGIHANNVLPERYFHKDKDGPGMLFNVRRFVKEYLIEEKKDAKCDRVQNAASGAGVQGS